jgi:ABC-type multidrug transport system ATPase subunit
MAEVTLTKLNKYFDTTHVVKDVDLQIRDKEFMVFVGPSGCGKTTTLRMIAGSRPSAPAISGSMTRWSTRCRRWIATSPWCSRTMRFIRT